MTDKTLVSAGELRLDQLLIFDPRDPAGIDLLLSAPGFLGQPFRGQAALARSPHLPVNAETAFAYRAMMLEHLARELERAPRAAEVEVQLLAWMEALKGRRSRALHLAEEARFTRLISRDTGTVVTPAPITRPMMEQQRELALELTGDAHDQARAWFAEQARQASDISEELLAILQASWAGGIRPPMDVYLKVLMEYFSSTIEGLDREADDNPMLEHLTEFQSQAYQYAKGILRRYGGVFLADVVGLGKTYIAMALLKHLQDRYGQHPVVIAPPAVLPAWDALAAEHRVELQGVSLGKLEDLHKYEDREVLVIDESHHFRNTGTRRYDEISNWLRPGGQASTRRVLLLSATPQNNDPRDVLNQLRLFPDNYSRLPYQGESLDGWFQDVRNGQQSLTTLLQHVVVRRTRRFIQAAYPDATLRRRVSPGKYVRVPLRFPTRVSGAEQCLRYRLDEAFGANHYDQIIEALAQMEYPLYGLGAFLLPEYRDRDEVKGIQRSGRGLRGLYKVLLLKRLESSAHALRLTLSRLLERMQDAMKLLYQQKKVRARVAVTSQDTSNDELEDVVTWDETLLPDHWFDTRRLKASIAGDMQHINRLLKGLQALDAQRDGKLSRLDAWLSKRPPQHHRTIIFTQFADTAAYLAEQLGQRHGRTALVTGSAGNKTDLSRRFAPKANRVEVPTENQIDLLVSTDALSEGVNLQDADTLINYDLHWNPVRLIQRAGRIDRIGSENEEIHIASFLPEKELESRLGIEQVLRRRIQEFLEVFGEDSAVLPADELPDEETMASAYTGAALEDDSSSDDMDGLSRHVERLLQLRGTERELYDRVAEMRLGQRAVSTSDAPPIIANRVGWFWSFTNHAHGQKPAEIDDLRGLDLLWEHAEAGESTPLPEDAAETLAALMERARLDFEPKAELFLRQRQHPRLAPTESWVLDQLERYREECVVTRQALVDDIKRWVLEGHAKPRVQRESRVWRRQKLSAESVFQELRSLYSRFPPQDEQLGEAQLVGGVLGVGS